MTLSLGPAIAVLETDHVVQLGRGRLDQIARHHGLELMYLLRRNVDRLALRHAALDQRLALLQPQDDLPREHVDRFVLLVVVLQGQHVARLDVQDLADVAVGAGPDDLVAPRLGDAIRNLFHHGLRKASTPTKTGWSRMRSRTRRSPRTPRRESPGVRAHP